MDNDKIRSYDEVVATVMRNVLAEFNINNCVILWDFDETKITHRLYFNVAAIVADMNKHPLYVQMDFIPYIKMKWRRRKSRKNLRRVSSWMKRRFPEEERTSVDTLMEFVKEYHGIGNEFIKEINNEYYGWI